MTASEQETKGRGWQPLFYNGGIKVQREGDFQVPTNEPRAEAPNTRPGSQSYSAILRVTVPEGPPTK